MIFGNQINQAIVMRLMREWYNDQTDCMADWLNGEISTGVLETLLIELDIEYAEKITKGISDE